MHINRIFFCICWALAQGIPARQLANRMQHNELIGEQWVISTWFSLESLAGTWMAVRGIEGLSGRLS
jgi:hypothetical protein